jgi:hypothetical protein
MKQKRRAFVLLAAGIWAGISFSAEAQLPMEHLMESFRLIEAQTIDPWLYGRVEYVSDPDAALAGWRSLTEEAASRFTDQWKSEYGDTGEELELLIAREVDRRESSFLRRIRVRQYGDGRTPVSLYPSSSGGDWTGQLALLEDRERELVSGRLEWERATGESYHEGLLRAEEESARFSEAMKLWKEGALEELELERMRTEGSLGELDLELERCREAEEGTRLNSAVSLLDGIRGVTERLSESRDILFLLQAEAARSSGNERLNRLGDIEVLKDYMAEDESLLEAYCTEADGFLESPIGSDAEGALERLAAAREIQAEFDRLFASGTVSGENGMTADFSVELEGGRREIEEIVRREALQSALFEAIARRLSEEDMHPGETDMSDEKRYLLMLEEREKDLAGAVSGLEEGLAELKAKKEYDLLELQRLVDDCGRQVRVMWDEGAAAAAGESGFENSLADMIEDGSLSGLIRLSALSGQAPGGAAEPDLAAHNSVFRSILREIGSGEKELLASASAAAAAEIEGSGELKIRADTLLEILRSCPEGEIGRSLKGAMNAELNRIVLDEGLLLLNRKIDGYSSRITAYSAQAATSAAIAAICYAGFNIPGGVAATAASIAAAAAASSFKEKRGDLRELRRMASAISMDTGNGARRIGEELEKLASLRSRREAALLEVEKDADLLWIEHPGEEALEALSSVPAAGKSLETIYGEAAVLLENRRREAAGAAGLLERDCASRFRAERNSFLGLAASACLSDDETFRRLVEEGVSVYRNQEIRRGFNGIVSSRGGYTAELTERIQSAIADRLELRRKESLQTDNYRRGISAYFGALRSEMADAAFSAALSWWNGKGEELRSGAAEWKRDFILQAEEGRAGWKRAEEDFFREREQIAERLYRGEAVRAAEVFASFQAGPDLPGIPAFQEHPLSPFFTLPADISGFITQEEKLEETPEEREWSSAEAAAGLEERLERLHAESVQASAKMEGMLESGLKNSLMGRLLDLEEGLRNAVAGANRQVRGEIEISMLKSGYRLDGNIFGREALVDLWLGGHERKRQEIESYRDFILPDFNWRGKLSSLRAGGEEAVRLFSRAAMESDLVFSSSDDGMFGLHTGSPPCGEDPGSGEYGRIFSLFALHETELGRGLSMMETAFHDRRFWDDDEDNDGKGDSFFKAPTIRSAADVGMQIAAATLLGPGLGSIALGMTDDLLFSVGDIASGGDQVEILGRLGKKAAVSLAGSGGAGPGWFEGSSWLLDAGSSAASAAVRQTVSSGISSLSISSEGLGFDRDLFLSSAFSVDALAGIGSAAAGSAAGSFYANAYLTKEASCGLNSIQLAQMKSTGSLLSGAAGSAFSTALTGELNVNLLNASDFGTLAGLDIASSGMLELRLGGSGASLELGSGGLDLSAGRVLDAAEGYGHLAMRSRIAGFASDSKELLKPALLFQYGFGDEMALGQLERLLSGEDILRTASDAENRGGYSWCETKEGTSGRIITISPGGNDAPLTAIGLASMLQHEAYRDGAAGSDNRGETAAAFAAHSGLVRRAGMDPLYGMELILQDPFMLREQMAIAAGAGDLLASIVFDSSGDYYRLTEEGGLLFDGSHHLWSSGGGLLSAHDRGSFSQSLADHFGISKNEALVLMEESGLSWNAPSNSYVDSSPEEGIAVPGDILARAELFDLYGPARVEEMEQSRRSAYAWALREKALRRSQGDFESIRYELALDEALGSYERFAALTGTSGERSFTGIESEATLHHYSQQNLERAVLGEAFSPGSGNGYCLAESIAFAYADRYPGISMDDIGEAFIHGSFGSSFDRTDGTVGSKTEFSRALGRELGVSSYLTEERYASISELDKAIGKSGKDYFILADYGSHFTHVQPGGLEVNSYSGWIKGDREPEEWRLMSWNRGD